MWYFFVFSLGNVYMGFDNLVLRLRCFVGFCFGFYFLVEDKFCF